MRNVPECPNDVAAFLSMARQSGTVDEAVTCLIERPTTPRILVRDIQRAVCRRFNVTHVDLVAHRHFKALMQPRHVAVYLACSLTTRSLAEIGRSFDRDHTTILYAKQKMARLMETDDDLRDLITTLSQELQNAFVRQEIDHQHDCHHPHAEGQGRDG